MIIKCPECSKKVSSHAQMCPTCGYPLKKNRPKKETPKTSSKWFWADKRDQRKKSQETISCYGDCRKK